MRRSTTAITLLCNVFPMTLRPGWCGELLVGVGHGLGHSSLAAAVLSSRVWIDNSMRHQNGRSRAAVASSLLSRPVFPHCPDKDHCGRPEPAGFLYFKPSLLTRPALSVVYGALTHMFPCLDLHR
ncbi:hypothetical protein GGI35DRAFT_400709 [Trichoderma velutinum]